MDVLGRLIPSASSDVWQQLLTAVSATGFLIAFGAWFLTTVRVDKGKPEDEAEGE